LDLWSDATLSATKSLPAPIHPFRVMHLALRIGIIEATVMT
jgi:hypothetical protein